MTAPSPWRSDPEWLAAQARLLDETGDHDEQLLRSTVAAFDLATIERRYRDRLPS